MPPRALGPAVLCTPFTLGGLRPMALCEDPALTYLTGLGYNAVRHPSTKFQPLDVLGRDRAVEWLGPLTSFCTSSVAPPAPAVAKTASVSATKTNALNLDVGLKILSSVLAAFGADGGAVHSAHTGARYLRFSFPTPTLRSVEPIALGQWLKTAKPDRRNAVVDRYLGSDDCSAYVITEILTSNRITVSTLSSARDAHAVDLPAIQQAVGAHLTVEQAANAQGEIVYTGKKLLTFGFKAFALTHTFGRWALRDIRPGEASAGPEEGAAGHVFEDGWVDLADSGPEPERLQ